MQTSTSQPVLGPLVHIRVDLAPVGVAEIEKRAVCVEGADTEWARSFGGDHESSRSRVRVHIANPVHPLRLVT